MVGSEHRIHMACEQQLEPRIGAHLYVKISAMDQRRLTPIGVDAGRRLRLQQRRLAGQGAERIGEHLRHRSEEHTSELQSLMRISYAVFCLKKKTNNTTTHNINRDKNK